MPRHGSPALANAPVPVSFTPLPPVGLLPVEEHSSRESGTLGQDTGHLCRRKGPGDSWPRPMGRDRRTSPSSSQRFARAGGKNKNTHVRVTGSVRTRSEREGAAGEPAARPPSCAGTEPWSAAAARRAGHASRPQLCALSLSASQSQLRL